MKASPVISTIIIGILLGTILGLVGYIAKVKYVADKTPIEQETSTKFFEDYVEFRFTSKPKSIVIKDGENKVLYETTDLEEPYEHVAEMRIPMDADEKSFLKIFIEWEKPLEMNSFQMEFPGYLPKIADWSSGDIVTETEFHWKEVSDD